MRSEHNNTCFLPCWLHSYWCIYQPGFLCIEKWINGARSVQIGLVKSSSIDVHNVERKVSSNMTSSDEKLSALLKDLNELSAHLHKRGEHSLVLSQQFATNAH